jgi:hypothetical protein
MVRASLSLQVREVPDAPLLKKYLVIGRSSLNPVFQLGASRFCPTGAGIAPEGIVPIPEVWIPRISNRQLL